MPALILASSSPYRRALLERLNLPFSCASPDIDETPQQDESPTDYVARLALEKARALAPQHPDAIIIGSDQCCVLDGTIVGKPGNFDNASKHLQACSDKHVTFLTGLCVLNSADNSHQVCVEPYHVHFRTLSQTMIENYLNAEQPYDCAGSFKMEGLGIALFSKLEGDDPNSLIGLPLIRLISMLDQQGLRAI
ncbi:Maf family protein [Aliamphritea spongicola]|uniref:Maf family protein n=1 Tax=Aliamphritea spongicola TaxID=707589 RepID=UPI00196AE8B5|nr:nucleoside triphosphate pyrophosphatase [Aliamphritea spongicola]MBN3561269.1 septum formation inhibitor Maf [Aliamphritea spongicola]